MRNIFNSWRQHIYKLNEAACKIPVENSELDKDDMPQIKPEQIQDFILDLQEQGVQVLKTRVKVEDLKPTQSQLEWEKVQELMKQPVEKLKNGVPIFVSKDNEIADGHHRWYALKMIDQHADMPVWQVDMDALPLIHLMKRFEDRQSQEPVYTDQMEE